MKIAILQPTPFRKGHYFIYTNSLLKELNEANHNVCIVSANKSFKGKILERDSNLNFNIYSFKGLILYLFLCYSTIFRFVLLRRNFEKLIILDCEYSSISVLFFLLKLLQWKGKVTLQINAPNFYNFEKKNYSFYEFLKIIQSYIFKRSLNLMDLKISCLGEWHKTELSNQLKFNKTKIVVIEDGGGGLIKKISEKNLSNKMDEALIKYPKKNKPIFLLFGNMRKDKGYLFLSLVWEKYFNSKEDPYLWIVGHDEENLSKRLIRESSQNIIIHNSYIPLELISCIYQKADYAILPYLSSYRGGSGPLMKGAFTHSKLALVANVSEMGRIAKEEKLAEYFEAENAKSLIKSIKKIINNGKDHYKNTVQNAKNYADKRDWKSLSRKFLKSLE